MADITGTAGADILVGTVGDDVVDALGGNDQIWAGAGDVGNDLVSGGDGDDIMGGGAGDDILLGDNHDGATDLGAPGDDGANTLFGGDGDDLLITGGYSNDGTDVTLAGAAGGAYSGFVTGTGGSTAWAGAGEDIVYGGGGDDILGGGAGADEVYAGAGNDIIYAGVGDDDEIFNGGGGNDTIFNGGGNDTVDGGTGDDVLWGGGGDDEITSGAGSDIIGFIAGNGNDTVTDFTLGEDVLDLQAFSGTFADAAAVVDAMADIPGGVKLTLASGQVVTLLGLTSTDFATAEEPWVNLSGTPEALPAGATYILTTAVDFIDIEGGAADLVKGVVDGDADADTSNSTYTVADTVFGNGNTILELAVVESGDSAFATLSDLNRIDIVAATTGYVTFDASDWSGIGSVNLLRGADDLDVSVENAAPGMGASISDRLAGSVEIYDTDDGYLFIEADEDDSVFVASGGNVDVNVAASGSVDVEITNSGTGDVIVGDVTAVVGSSADLEVDFSSDEGALTVGDIMVDAGLSASIDFWFSADGTGDITVGDITISGSASDVSVSISQHEVADIVVGDNHRAGVRWHIGHEWDLPGSRYDYSASSSSG